MSVVKIKCPKCGVSTQLDDKQEYGFCSYCGAKITSQEVVSFVEIDNTNNLKNYLQLAKNALDGKNGEETYIYANKILELDSLNGEAWLLKMYALDFLGSLKELRVDEIITCGNNAIKFAKNHNIQEKVNTFFLLKAIAILNQCYEKMANTHSIENLYKANCAVNSMKASKETRDFDSSFINLIENAASYALKLKRTVLIELIEKSIDYRNYVEKIANGYIIYSKALILRYRIYGSKLTDSAINVRRNILVNLKKGLSEEQKQSIPENKISNMQEGCYIATAIYGSYDAPEVLTLRHFRDSVLAKKYYGRLFIRVYYYLSPSLAVKLKRTKHINSLIKWGLDKCVLRLEKEKKV
jgi:hypothetical protein